MFASSTSAILSPQFYSCKLLDESKIIEAFKHINTTFQPWTGDSKKLWDAVVRILQGEYMEWLSHSENKSDKE